MTFQRSFVCLMTLYVAAMLWVWSGAIFYSEGGLLPMMAAHLLAAGAMAATIYGLSQNRLLPALPKFSVADSFMVGLGTALVAMVFIHWWALGGIPILQVLQTTDYVTAGLIRTRIPQVTVPLVNYIPTLVIKAGIPFLVIYFFHRRRPYVAFAFAVFGLIYAVSLIQKSYPAFITIPPMIYLLLNRKLIRAAIMGLVAIASVSFLVIATNPDMRTTQVPEGAIATEVPQSEVIELPPLNPPANTIASNTNAIVESLAGRVILDPGLMVERWFAVFPETFPFNGMCGYRFLARFAGCDFVGNSTRTWLHYYPDLAEKGYSGSMGAAHFMEEYASFGAWGLVLAGVLASVVVAVAAVMTTHLGFAALVALNFPFIMALSSTGLHTTILSGGWAAVLLLSLAWPSTSRRAIPVGGSQPGT